MVLADIKQYLNIDVDNTVDDILLLSLWETAEDYVRGAVDDYDTKAAASAGFISKSETAQKVIIQELYDNRRQANTGTKDYSYTVRGLISQLQYTPVEGA